MGIGDGMVFPYEFISALLVVASDVAVRELVALEAVVNSNLRVVEDGGGGRGRRPRWTSLGARPMAALTGSL